MRTTKIGYCITLILLAFIFSPAVLFSGTIYFDLNGNVVDNLRHEQIVVDREKFISKELSSGYTPESKYWKDPIKLRIRRIEQWKSMRAMYNPLSLPSKIERKPVTR